MSWWLFILLIIPAICSILAWVQYRTIVWWEAGLGLLLAAVTVQCVIWLSQWGLGQDVETWSGHVQSVTNIPQWVSRHTKTYTVTVGTGKDAHTETRTRTVYTTHPEEWFASTNVGRLDLSKSEYSKMSAEFGGAKAVKGSRPSYDSGDRNDYIATWKGDVHLPMYPVSVERRWTNKLLAVKDTVYQYPEVDSAGLFEYPRVEDNFHSNRVLGTSLFSTYRWDQLNAFLGPRKQVNLIAIGFGPKGTFDQAVRQEAYWKGGKKNDLVLCYGGGTPKNPDWSYVFGWTEREYVKQDLQSMLISNDVNDSLIPNIEESVRTYYQIMDWHQFDDLEPPVPWWGVVLAIVITTIGQFLFYIWAHENQHREFAR